MRSPVVVTRRLAIHMTGADVNSDPNDPHNPWRGKAMPFAGPNSGVGDKEKEQVQQTVPALQTEPAQQTEPAPAPPETGASAEAIGA